MGWHRKIETGASKSSNKASDISDESLTLAKDVLRKGAEWAGQTIISRINYSEVRKTSKSSVQWGIHNKKF